MEPQAKRLRPESARVREQREKREAARHQLDLEIAEDRARTEATHQEIMMFCRWCIGQVEYTDWALPFMEPVDPEEFDPPLHDYFDIIKEPMDLGTVLSKIESGAYPSPDAFMADVTRVFDNCHEYNKPGSEIRTTAAKIENFITQIYKKYLPEITMRKDCFNNVMWWNVHYMRCFAPLYDRGPFWEGVHRWYEVHQDKADPYTKPTGTMVFFVEL